MSWPPEEMNLTDLGNGVQFSKYIDNDDQWIGILEWHKCHSEEITAGSVLFDNAPEKFRGPRWTLVQEEPLTINPSILCRTCGLHGFIQNGRWVPA